ncbi:MAG: phosphonate metabolism transcriptional regulator PhnF [Cyanobacteria bacterium J06621_12]
MEHRPIYIQIADELKQNIQQEVYLSGDKLPTEKNLADRFSVNRHTIRNAIALLKEEGLIRVDRGRGMYVATAPIRYPIGKRVRYNESLNVQGIEASYQKLRAIAIPAEPAIANALKIETGVKVILIERIGLANDQPISIGSSYFPDARFPDLIANWEKYASISKMLEEQYNCEHLRQSTTVSARIVREADARLLQIPVNQPILLAKSINCDLKHNVVEYGVTRFSGAMMELIFKTINN